MHAVRNDSSVWFIFLPVAPLRSAAAVIPGLAAVTLTLALLSSVLLSHLLCFHIYLSKTLTCLSVSVNFVKLVCLHRVFDNYCWALSVCLSMFLVWNRLSTYEYIVRQRHRQDNRDSRKPAAVAEAAAPSVDLVKVSERPKCLNSGKLPL